MEEKMPDASITLPVTEIAEKPEVKKFPWLLSLLFFGIAVVGILFWFGYQQLLITKHSVKQHTLYTGTIKIGYIAFWPGYLGLFLARDKGYFKAEGLNVQLKKYDGGTPLIADYVHGLLQGRADVTVDAVIEAYKGLDQKAVLEIDYSNGADGIISKSNIKNFQELKGKKFAFEKGSTEEFFTLYALQENTMSITDIIPVNLDPTKAAEALANGEVDAATTFDPTLSQVVDQIKGNRLYTSADAPGIITDILSFRSDFIKQYPDAVQAFIRAYFKGIAYWKQHPKEANILIGHELGLTPDDTHAALQGITILDTQDNMTAFTFAAGLQSLYGNFRQAGRFVQNKQATTKQLDTDALIDPQFMNKLSSN